MANQLSELFRKLINGKLYAGYFEELVILATIDLMYPSSGAGALVLIINLGGFY